jgi:hypothetical protein
MPKKLSKEYPYTIANAETKVLSDKGLILEFINSRSLIITFPHINEFFESNNGLDILEYIDGNGGTYNFVLYRDELENVLKNKNHG